MIEAKIICDSVSPEGQRLTTFKLRYPKFIHGEFMAYRVFSRNSSSSRTSSVAKNIEEVRSDARAAPVYWGDEQKGMQSGEELSDENTPGATTRLVVQHAQPLPSPRQMAQGQWKEVALKAAAIAESMFYIGLHKSIVNCILEPFLHINVVCTATEYANFFDLRLDKAAQPEMRALAEAMWREYGESMPTIKQPGQWHLPFVEMGEEFSKLLQAGYEHCADEVGGKMNIYGGPLKISVARCARASYESFETGRRSTIEEDLCLYDCLVESHPMHASLAEHQATPDEPVMKRPLFSNVKVASGEWMNQRPYGNFIGWRQHRKLLASEAVAPLPNGYIT